MSRREFHFQEGNSHKFWTIEVEGPKFTVHFGRLGTAGQAQVKEFTSDAEAQKASDKLVAEKTKKGYFEVAATTAAPAKPAKVKKAGAAPEAPAAAEPVKTATAPATVITRRIDLEPRDWLWATWRPRQPLPKHGPPPAFTVDKGMSRIQAGMKAQPDYWWAWGWLKLKGPLSREEAHFWFDLVISEIRVSKTQQKLLEKHAKQSFDGNLSFNDIMKRLRGRKQHFSDDDEVLTHILPVLLTPAELVEFTLTDFPQEFWRLPRMLLTTLLNEVLPRLTVEELESIKPVLRPRLDPKKYPPDFIRNEQPAFRLAAAIGMRPEMEALVKSWPDGLFAPDPWAQEPQWYVYALGEARQVDQHMRRVKLTLKSPEHARAWLAHTEYSALDHVRDSILGGTNKPWIESMVEVLCLVKAPEAAPHLLDLRLNGKAPNLISAWLDENLGTAIAGLIPVAAGKGKLADAAVEFLRATKKKGHADFIAEQLKTAPAEVAARVRESVLEHEEKVYAPLDRKTTPKPLREAFATASAGKTFPAWAAPAFLRPILVGEGRLSDEQVTAVLAALRQTPLGSSSPLLEALRTHADRNALDAFAWDLFERWLTEGAPSKEKWAMLALGHFGGDLSVMKLTPLVRAWPGDNQHPRAVLGLECLRAIGTDTALMQLNGIAQKLKFQGLKNKAKEFMEAIASDKGLSREELEDLIVPDLGLDERGTRVLDFGPRQFRVALAADLTPMVRDDAGKLKADLPKPGASDDAPKAEAAVADWKLLKKQLRDALKIQSPRLEQAMVTGRRWPVERFEASLVRHPLMTHLAQRLLWGGYDGKGTLRTLFRVTEERDYADANDKPIALKGVATVGIVHPLHLTAEQMTTWGECFGNYEIIPPFPQLGRPVLAVEPAEAKSKALTRLAKAKIPPMAVRGTLERLSWTRGSTSDHGVIQEFSKHFPTANVTVVLEVEPGIPIGAPDWAEDQSVPRVFFFPGKYDSVAYPYHKEADFLVMNKVEPVTVSEVLTDLNEIAAKQK